MLARKPSFWLLSLRRRFGLDPRLRPDLLAAELLQPQLRPRRLAEVGWFYGSIVLVGGVAGTWLGGWLGDRLGPRATRSLCAASPRSASWSPRRPSRSACSRPNLWLAWLLFALGQMTALAWLGPVIAAVQHIVRPAMRATASASFLFINNLIGIGCRHLLPRLAVGSR